MKIDMQFSDSSVNLSFTKWDIAYVGTAVDERGRTVVDFLSTNSLKVVTIEYIAREFKVRIDGEEFDKDDINQQLGEHQNSAVVLDATTLNFAELLIISEAIKQTAALDLSVIYVEPKKYKRKSKSLDILHKRDFDLSEAIIGYEAIPGHALLVTNELTQKVVFLCGFEAERIDRALEDSQIVPANCSCVFGVPAYIPGWEMDSFDNHIDIVKERRLMGGVYFCGATNPLSVFQTLEDIYSGLDDEDQMFVAPLATKPMNIGACLFLIDKPKSKVAVLYDHPKETIGKALDISTWHLFNINLE